MRTRKKRGSKPAAVTLSNSEIMEACDFYLKSQGFKLGNQSWMKIEMPKGNRHSKVEVTVEIENETSG